MAGLMRVALGRGARAWARPATASAWRLSGARLINSKANDGGKFDTRESVAGKWGPGTFDGGSTVIVGQEGEDSFRMAFKDRFGNPISPWHDIRLFTAQYGVFNMVVEIPKMTTAKMEVAIKEENNPIAQDVKKGKLRHYHGPIFWNYGMLPQTWENPAVIHEETKCGGDNDPVDIVEIGSRSLPMGTVEPVKPLGVLAMIDDGELDWKVIGISIADPLAAELKNVDDIEAKCPGVISGIREWFRWYKTPDGKPLNAFGYEEKCLDKVTALNVIGETHLAWQKLTSLQTDAGKLWVKLKE